MAKPSDANDARGRLPLLASLVAFAAATAVAFGRVYQGGTATAKLVAAAAGAILLAAAFERIHVLLSTILSAAGLVVALGLLVFPETTAFGLPTPQTLHATGLAFQAVGGLAARTVAPVGPFPELLLAGVVAVWTASFAAHALVARAGSGILALLPAGALVGFSDIVLQDGVRPAYMVLFLLSAFAVLSTLGLRWAVRWGQLVPWSGAKRWSLFSTNALRAARRAAVPAVLSAVLIPWALPGLNHPGWYAIAGGPNGSVTIDPIVDLKPSLNLDPPRLLFTVATPKAAYWRMLSLDRFDGRRWSASNLKGEAAQPIANASSLQTSAEPGVAAIDLQVDVRIEALSSLWLPLPYEASFVDVPANQVRYDPSMSTVFLPDLTDRGLGYHAIGSVLDPPLSQLDVPFDLDDAFYRSGNTFLDLPADLPPQITKIAHQLTDDQPTPYRKALAVQNYLHNNFRYNEHAPAGHSSNHLVNFLTQTHEGYCEQFAGAMAVLLRAVGVPTRVAVGFTEGAFDPHDKRYHITTRNAHSWVEVHLGKFGWLPFEPTPGRANPTADTYQNPVALSDGSTPPGQVPDPRVSNRPNPQGTHEPRAGLGPDAAKPKAGPRSFAATAVISSVALLMLLLAAIPLVKRGARKLAVSRAKGERARALAAYGVFARRLGDLGLRRANGETLWEFRDRLRARLTLPQGSLERLTRLTGRAAYAGTDLTPKEAAEVVALADGAAGEAERAVGRGRRLMGIWRISFGRTRNRPPRGRRLGWSPAAAGLR